MVAVPSIHWEAVSVNMNRSLLWVACFLFFLASSSVAAGDFPWSEVPGVKDSEFKPEFLRVVEKKLNSIPSYGRCKESVFSCLKKKEHHGSAARLARDVLILMAEQSSDDEIAKWVEARKQMAHPAPEKVKNVRLEGLTPLGKADAKIVLVEFSDFQCPFCARLAPLLEKVTRESQGKVRLYFKQFPIKSHDRALAAARACVASDSLGKFWEYCGLLFAHQDDLSDESILGLAKKAGMDVEKFRSIMEKESVLNRIADEKMEGLKFHIEGTPTLYVNGKEFLLLPTERLLRDRIEEEWDILHEKD